ncbi:hypothetical protein DFJ73DRAFT_47234 [Zopfochytrium polystomum]|nr:hypothetical protein DFJ73DRAFT_47234 [Zopfochytrium polystomum]
MSFMDLRGWLSGSTRANVSATVAGPQTPGPSTPGLPSTPAAGCNSPPDEDLASPNHSFATGFAESHYHDDAPTSYCYVLANHRSPLRLTPSPSSARSTFPASLPCTILPLATGWLIDVPRRDSAGTSGFVSSPPSEFTPVNAATPIATSASSTSSAGVASLATPASSGSGQSPIRTALPPPKQPASRSFEVSLLRHYTPEHRRGSADAMPTIYSGWEKGSTLTKSATSDVSSVPSPTAAVPITNGGLLNTGGVGSPPGVIPSAPVSPPQAHHVNIVRDIIRQYHALRFANRGSSDFILGSSTIGEGGFSDGLPWVYQAAVALAKLL